MKSSIFFESLKKKCPWFYRVKGEPFCKATINKDFKYHCCKKNCAPWVIANAINDSEI